MISKVFLSNLKKNLLIFIIINLLTLSIANKMNNTNYTILNYFKFLD